MTAIVLPNGAHILRLQKEKRNRRSIAYVIFDAISNTVMLTQKLRLAADYINARFARGPLEEVTVAGLYEAAGTENNRVGGFHKMRFKIQRCDIGRAHNLFAAARIEGTNSVLLTSTPDCYPLAVR